MYLNYTRFLNRIFYAQKGTIMIGTGMGGGSSVNGMQYIRGSREDYNSWSKLGNTGWDFNSLLPYFKLSEDHTGEIPPKMSKKRLMRKFNL